MVNKLLKEEYLCFEDVLIKPMYSDFDISEIDLTTKISKEIVLKIPIIASPMDTVCGSDLAIELGKLGGLGIIHRNQTIKSQALEVKKVAGRKVLVGAAIGISEDTESRLKEIIKAGANIICIDYAIGHSKKAIDLALFIKNNYKIPVISSSITTIEAIIDYKNNGINIFRFGISNSPICVSKKISGVGMPLFSAILKTQNLKTKKDVFLIADSGIKTSGDISKALAAGAGAVMLGSMISGTKETPGKIIDKQGVLYKKYRGMGSVESMIKGSRDRYNQSNFIKLQPEGLNNLIQYKGHLKDVIDNIIYGLKTAMIKVGARNISEFQKKVEFIRISSNCK